MASSCIKYCCHVQQYVFMGKYTKKHNLQCDPLDILNKVACAVQGDMKAKFLRHEGFLGAVGAFLKVHPMSPPKESTTSAREPRKARPQPLLHMANVDVASFTLAAAMVLSCTAACSMCAIMHETL